MIYKNILETIGNTPMVRLENISKGIEATILAKLDFLSEEEALQVTERCLRIVKKKRGENGRQS